MVSLKSEWSIWSQNGQPGVGVIRRLTFKHLEPHLEKNENPNDFKRRFLTNLAALNSFDIQLERSLARGQAASTIP